MRFSRIRVGLALVLTTLWTVTVSEGQDSLTKRDRQGPVTVTVTLTPPVEPGAPLKAKVVLDTHSVELDAIKFEDVVALRTAEGTDTAPTTLERASGSGHHREAVLVFPSVAPGDAVRIVVKNVGGVAERNFTWELPALPR